MTFRIRTWAGEQPLPGLDVTTNSATTAACEVADRVMEYGSWTGVWLIRDGHDHLGGHNLAYWTLENLPDSRSALRKQLSGLNP